MQRCSIHFGSGFADLNSIKIIQLIFYMSVFIYVLYLWNTFLVQRRGRNGFTGLKRIQTSDGGSFVRSDREPVSLLVCRGIGSLCQKTTVVDIFCLFYQQTVALLLLTTPDLLEDTSSLFSVLVIWMVLTLPSAGWLSLSQPEHLISLALAMDPGINIWLEDSQV